MKLCAVTNFLILIYCLSITTFGSMEIGHEAMHTFKNAVHHHEADHHHILEDHDIMVLDHGTNSIDDILSSLSFSIAFYESCPVILLDVLPKTQYQLWDAGKTIAVVCLPLVPPPISI